MQHTLMGLALMCALVAPYPSNAQTPSMVPMPLSLEARPDDITRLNEQLRKLNSTAKPREVSGTSPRLTLFSTPLSGEGKSKSPTLDILRGRTN